MEPRDLRYGDARFNRNSQYATLTLILPTHLREGQGIKSQMQSYQRERMAA